MTALVLRWRAIPPPVITRWRGVTSTLFAGWDVMPRLIATVVGPPGPISAQGAPFEHVQASPASVWTVNHNLGWRPQVTVMSPGGIEVNAEIGHISSNQFQVRFNQPYAGTALAR